MTIEDLGNLSSPPNCTLYLYSIVGIRAYIQQPKVSTSSSERALTSCPLKLQPFTSNAPTLNHHRPGGLEQTLGLMARSSRLFVMRVTRGKQVASSYCKSVAKEERLRHCAPASSLRDLLRAFEVVADNPLNGGPTIQRSGFQHF